MHNQSPNSPVYLSIAPAAAQVKAPNGAVATVPRVRRRRRLLPQAQPHARRSLQPLLDFDFQL